jgi:hypothetical protein
MNAGGERWYRPPVVWIGLTVLVGSVAGCIALIFAATSA